MNKPKETPKQEILDDKIEKYNLSLTEWQHNALQSILLNGQYIGRDVLGVAKLIDKIKAAKG